MTDQYRENNPDEPRFDAPQEEPIVDEAPTGAGEEQPKAGETSPEKMTPEKFGEAALKFASETAYAAAGFANIVAAKARELYEHQRANSADKAEHSEGAANKDFLDQLNEQLNKFVDDVQHTYKDLADRGRTVVGKMTTVQPKTERDAQPGPFDIDDAADAADADEGPKTV